MQRKMRIYITGIAGMLGYGIVQELKEKTVIFGNDIVDIVIPGLSYTTVSLFDMPAVEQDILEKRIDILVHTAAMVSVDGCEENPEAAEKINTCVTAELSELCKKHRIKMVYISTDAVFDGEDSRLYTEEDKVNPLNVYGRTKLNGEAAVLKYPENLVFRTNIYGINIQKKLGFGEWVSHSLIEGKTLHMFTDIDFSPILVNELAELIYQACRKDLSGLYHACGTGCITKYDFGVKLKEVFHIKSGEICRSASEEAGLKAKRSKHRGMSNRKLADALHMEISTPEESIKKFCYLCGREEAAWK